MRRLRAVPVQGAAPVIDGQLNDAVWITAPIASEFWQLQPEPGLPARSRTEGRVAFDAKALYVAMRMYDPRPDSIVAPFLRRDDEGVSDWAFVEFDSRRDRRTSFSFGTNPRGVLVDGGFSGDSLWSPAWNGVWEAAARIDSLGWTAEFRIPLSQLSFAARAVSGDTGVWGISFYRYWARRGEVSNWSPRWPGLGGVVSLFNDLHGIAIPPQRRHVELIPYVVIRADHLQPPLQADRRIAAPVLGADFRMAVTSQLNLTGALRPDFGQVEADPSQVNLTAFETFLPEQRPLFVEGADAFRIGSPLTFLTRGNAFGQESPFYSRRIGRAPQATMPVGAGELPSSTTILAALKLSGRLHGGWSLGAMNIVTDAERVSTTTPAGSQSVVVEPITNVAVLRLAKDTREGSSGIGAFATALSRHDMPAHLAAELPVGAHTVGLDGRHRFRARRYELSGSLFASLLHGDSVAIARVSRQPWHNLQRPDATHLRNLATGQRMNGTRVDARLARLAGDWTWLGSVSAISPGFDMNEVGFQRNSDWIIAYGRLKYQVPKPGRWFRQLNVGADNLGLGWSLAGERRAAVANANVGFDFVNYWGGFFSVDREFPVLSTDHLRGGPALLLPARNNWWFSLYSDSRKRWQTKLDMSGGGEPVWNTHSASWSPSVWWRASDRIEVSLAPAFSRITEHWQYVAALNAFSGTRYVVGEMRQRGASLTGRATFSLSPRLTLQVYGQPFVSGAEFGHFQEVVSPRAARLADRVQAFDAAGVTETPMRDRVQIDADDDGTNDLDFANPDFNLAEFNGSAVLRWEFRPGSTLFLVWTQRRGHNSLDPIEWKRDVNRLFARLPDNRLALKLSYRFSR